MQIFFDPLNPFFKTPTGAAEQGTGAALQFQITDERYYDSAWTVLTKDGEEPVRHRMTFEEYSGGLIRFSVRLPDLSPGLYFYTFLVLSGGEDFACGRGEDGLGHMESEQPFHLSVYERGFEACPWFRGAVMYHVFVDRFFRTVPPPEAGKTRSTGEGGQVSPPGSGHTNPVRNRRYHRETSERPDFEPVNGTVLNNDFYGGSLDGVTAKLGYLESLSVDTIYLSPIFEAASNHKYDTGDYRRIDEGFGGLSAFRRLVGAAHERGMRIILDGVFNHTGDDSLYFNRYGEYPGKGACQSRQSPYFDWYDFTKWPDAYRCWWGVRTLPSLRRESNFPEFIAGEGGVLDLWLSEGADGFRLDVVDELSDEFVEKIRSRLSRYPGRLLIGEVWEDASDKIAYGRRRRYFLGRELDSVMNYPLREAVVESLRQGNFHLLEACVREQQDRYPKCVLDCLMNMLGTHDTARVVTSLMRRTRSLTRRQKAEAVLEGGELEEGLRRQRSAAFLQFFLYGNPCVYYGDEIGMQGAEDPFNRGYFEWEETEEEGSAMLNWYRRLAGLRKKLPQLKEGLFRLVYVSREVFVFSRGEGGEEILCGVNESDEEFFCQNLRIPPKSCNLALPGHETQKPLIY